MLSHPTFAFVAFPVIGGKHILLVPFSDHLRGILNNLNLELINEDKPGSVAKAQMEGSFVLNTDLDNLNAYLDLNDKPIKVIPETNNDFGGGHVIKTFNPVQVPLCQSANCLIEFFKNQTVTFGFSLPNGCQFRTTPLTLTCFSKLMLESYQFSIDMKTLGS